MFRSCRIIFREFTYFCTCVYLVKLIRLRYLINPGSAVVKALRYKSDRFRAVRLGICSVAADISVCPGGDSASKNEYQDIPGGKGSRCVRVTTLPPSCAECLVIWSRNRPEPSGPHRPVIGVALAFIIIISASSCTLAFGLLRDVLFIY